MSARSLAIVVLPDPGKPAIVITTMYEYKMKTAYEFRLLSETNATDVTDLTSVFGKGTGVTRLLWPCSKSFENIVYIKVVI